MITQSISFIKILFSSAESFTVPLQAPIALDCEATAFPQPEITWYLPSGRTTRISDLYLSKVPLFRWAEEMVA